MNVKSFLKRHPVLIYFVLAFALSWGTVMLVAGTGRFAGRALPASITFKIALSMLVGPSFSSLIMTAALEGKAGLSALLARQLRWRTGKRGALGLLLNPMLTVLILLGMAALVTPVYFPTFSPLGLLSGLLIGFFEETGWTGFATPRMLAQHKPLTAGLMMGLPWGIWHTLPGFLCSTPGREAMWLVEALIFWVSGLIAYRILMTWVYTRTNSLLIGQLMHMTFTGAFLAFIPAITQDQYFAFNMVEAAGLWLVTAVVVIYEIREIRYRRNPVETVQIPS